MTEHVPSPSFVPAGYSTSRLLGRGATSLVFLAQDPQGREVALKLPHTENENPAAAEMFSNEVRMTLQLRHPNLVQGLDGTPFGEGAFLALEYLPDGALDRRLEAGPLPQAEALSLLGDITQALQYLHRSGAVHQDVKAQNVYLRGKVGVLGDLGNSFMSAQGGKVGGSPFYMAPEIYQGSGSSSASDVYSLGVLAYELLAGRRPFLGETYDELMHYHMNSMPPSLSHLNPEVPRPLAKLAQRALAKSPTDRPSADEFWEALKEFLEPSSQPAVPTGPQLGRHAGVPAVPVEPPAATSETAEAETKKGAWWNPFKKR